MHFIKVMFSVFLTKKNRIKLYFCVVMKQTTDQILLLPILIAVLCGQLVFGQLAQNKIIVPEKLTELLEKKIELDRKNATAKRFTIQVSYGPYETTLEAMERFKSLFPEISAQIIFETPNYKIRAGQYATEREAQEVLVRIKRRFQSAFVLKP